MYSRTQNLSAHTYILLSHTYAYVSFLAYFSPDHLCVDTEAEAYDVTLKDVRDLIYFAGPLAQDMPTPHLHGQVGDCDSRTA